ncbi:hypothetical protein [Nonomuraea cavernae]|uniref:Uncharacterized protein n=1 Tax=Nonomuraea cavernae TaxID=2045107 RepID=A0A917YYQ4_9ACTN|nr:hypothetical protein [Nonomuraea cavernae]MCA2187302.1 hypothetical protein [Nonomuraea cavernae]GGO68199.1 hypothetical protein GCM10012289_26410 [Nonomuraea cavernae]
MNEDDRAAAHTLQNLFATLGADDPQGRALSETSEDIPQLARFLALRHIWPDLINSWAAPDALEDIPAAARLLAHGADLTDLARVAQVAAYETAFGLLYSLTAYGRDHEAPEDTPGWRLMETTPAGELTGRAVQSLHESLLSMDPSGRDGQDIFG